MFSVLKRDNSNGHNNNSSYPWENMFIYTTISYLSVQQSKLSPRGAVDDPMALLHEAEGRGQQCIGSFIAPRV